MSSSANNRSRARKSGAVRDFRDFVDANHELALLRELIQAASSGPGVEPLAAAAARMITAATGTDVCFVHVLDDTERSLTLTGATPPFDTEVGKIRLPLESGVSGWVARHREPVVISDDKEADPRYVPIERCADAISPRWSRCRWRPIRAASWGCSTCTP
ncbi:hypothetical protein MSEN_00030 [Mycolicibacter senuensis]|uniref:GAF domain-containing protein n=1 Tax=Mycolicibacter senuensis TaxID=386913 RepID=A0A7I9XE74_9MYCO|nr:hypothetical protein MSEN_00030 [Mycolicibacter senuensis]